LLAFGQIIQIKASCFTVVLLSDKFKLSSSSRLVLRYKSTSINHAQSHRILSSRDTTRFSDIYEPA